MPNIPVRLVVELSKIRAALKSPISSTNNVGLMRLEALITDLELEPNKWITERLERSTTFEGGNYYNRLHGT